jgi:hypothetical protein
MHRKDLAPYIKKGCIGLGVAFLLYMFNSFIAASFAVFTMSTNTSAGNETFSITDAENVHHVFQVATVMTLIEGTVLLFLLWLVTLLGRQNHAAEQRKEYSFSILNQMPSSPKAHIEFDLDEINDSHSL